MSYGASYFVLFFFFKQQTAYEMRIIDWSSDVCSSDLLYDSEKMPVDLREAHERNDEVLERIYIGRRFRNDTERLEKLFDLYTKMTATAGATKKRKAGAAA